MKPGEIIHFTKIADPRGNLAVAQPGSDLPFRPQRIYWLYDIPGGASRGGHAHKQCREVIVAMAGSFRVNLDNGAGQQSFFLNHPNQGLLVEAGTWRTLEDFSSGAVCLVLASDFFDEADYIRDYRDFIDSLHV